MQTISSDEFRFAIDADQLSVIPLATRLGHFPEFALRNGRHEMMRIGCLAYGSPRAEIIDGTTVVQIKGHPGVREAINITCRNDDEADLIACVLDQHLQMAFEVQFGKVL